MHVEAYFSYVTVMDAQDENGETALMLAAGAGRCVMYVCMHACMYVCMYVCLFVRVCVCMYVYVLVMS
jgi:hypothetical protein